MEGGKLKNPEIFYIISFFINCQQEKSISITNIVQVKVDDGPLEFF